MIPKSPRNCKISVEGNPSYSDVNTLKIVIGESSSTPEPTYDVVNTTRIDVDEVYAGQKNEYEEIKETNAISSSRGIGLNETLEYYDDTQESIKVRVSPKDKSLDTNGEDTNFNQLEMAGVDHVDVKNNPSYSTISIPVSQYSCGLAGPDHCDVKPSKICGERSMTPKDENGDFEIYSVSNRNSEDVYDLR